MGERGGGWGRGEGKGDREGASGRVRRGRKDKGLKERITFSILSSVCSF